MNGLSIVERLRAILSSCSNDECEVCEVVTEAADTIEELAGALNMCRAIIKFHVKNAGMCCSFSPDSKPFSALEAHDAAIAALAKVNGIGEGRQGA